MPRPISGVLSLPFWQDRKEGHPVPTKPRKIIQSILSKHEVGASAHKIYRLALVSNPPLDGGPAALPSAGGCQGGTPLVALCLLSVDTERRAPPARRSKRWLENYGKGVRRTERPNNHSRTAPAAPSQTTAKDDTKLQNQKGKPVRSKNARPPYR